MIDSPWRAFPLAPDLAPSKRRLIDIEDPAIIDAPIPNVASKDN
jgi:hypothetical protein